MAVELRRAVVAADAASAAKSEFLARMSHELRNPLNAIIGYGQLLREEAEDTDDDPLTRDVDRILDAGHHLIRLIDMILDLSEIEAGRMRFDVRAHGLGALVSDAVARGRAAIEARGSRVELALGPDLGVVRVDATRLGEGAAFTVTLPVEPAIAAEEARRDEAPERRGRRRRGAA